MTWCCQVPSHCLFRWMNLCDYILAWIEFLKSIKDLHSPCCCLHPTDYYLIGITFLYFNGLLCLKLFLRLPVVLSSSPLKILEGFCCGIHSNRIHIIRNDLICFIEEGLFCLYNGSKTDKIWNYIFQWGQSSMVAIGPVRLCLVKIYIYAIVYN